jgi:hypothetical protein
MLPEPAGGGFAFQQISDGWQRSQQFLFLIRHIYGARLFAWTRRHGTGCHRKTSQARQDFSLEPDQKTVPSWRRRTAPIPKRIG